MTRNTTLHRIGTRSGFSLIELIIVVAVVGIIASLAMNNYMSAKTRAEVAAAYTNMKFIADANTAYYLDNGRFIPNPREVDGLPKGYFIGFDQDGYGRLTSPIAYLSRPVVDPFQFRRVPTAAEDHSEGQQWPWHYGVDPSHSVAFVLKSVGPDRKLNFPFAALDDARPQLSVTLPNGNDVQAYQNMHSLAWYFQAGHLRSSDEVRRAYLDADTTLLPFATDNPKSPYFPRVYDPTNGYRSGGDLIYVSHQTSR